jgi:hypothetical protein
MLDLLFFNKLVARLTGYARLQPRKSLRNSIIFNTQNENGVIQETPSLANSFQAPTNPTLHFERRPNRIKTINHVSLGGAV